jgi:DtxR family Mn-dependent transcriptional regulator
MKFSKAEEDYLKAIYHLADKEAPVATNAIAEELQTKPASVTDMVRKLAEKGALHYIKYKGTDLTETGRAAALKLIRKHRLWEVFLVEKLKFKWHEIHEVAEQLEHIRSPLLIQKLDEFLDFPKFDPHGDPIPDADGVMAAQDRFPLSKAPENGSVTIVSVDDSDPQLLQYLSKQLLLPGTTIEVGNRLRFDNSVEVNIAGGAVVMLSAMVAEAIFVQSS